MKQKEEYTLQFDFGDSENELIEPKICVGCEKICDSIDEKGFCYDCQEKLKRQKTNKETESYYSPLILEHNEKLLEQNVNNKVDINKFFGIPLKLKILFAFFPSGMLILLLVLGIILNIDMLFGFAIAFVGWAVYGLIIANPIIKNIRMLKNMQLYLEAKKGASNTNKVLLDEKIFIITEKFIYSTYPWAVLPTQHIELVEVIRGYKRNINTLYLLATMASGKKFIFCSVTIKYKQVLIKYIDELVKTNPLIKIEYED